MQLTDYKIKEEEGRKIINFNQVSLEGLEPIMNFYFNFVEDIDIILGELNLIKNNWNDIDTIVEDNFGGYFDGFDLKQLNLTGDWFSMWGWVNAAIIVNKADKKIYIKTLLEPLPDVVLTIDEFIDILEQWKQIQLS